MAEGKWNRIQHQASNEKYVASKAVVQHFRGSEYPDSVVVWIKRGQNGTVIRKFIATEKGRHVYDTQVIREETV
jgi:hypothetical protein